MARKDLKVRLENANKEYEEGTIEWDEDLPAPEFVIFDNKLYRSTQVTLQGVVQYFISYAPSVKKNEEG